MTTREKSAAPLVTKKFDWRPVWMVGPALPIPAVALRHPISRSPYLSLQADRGLEPATAMVSDGGFAGIQHYRSWLPQACPGPGPGGAGTVTCPPGVSSVDFWPAMANTLFFTVTAVSLETVLG